MKNVKERRAQLRVPLLSEKCTWLNQNWTSNESDLYDISSEGLYINSPKNPEINEVLEIQLKLPGDLGTLILKGKVVWRQWAQTKKNKRPVGFAVKFIEVGPNVQKIMDSYCVYLRNKQIITVSKRIVEEFFAKGPLDEK